MSEIKTGPIEYRVREYTWNDILDLIRKDCQVAVDDEKHYEIRFVGHEPTEKDFRLLQIHLYDKPLEEVNAQQMRRPRADVKARSDDAPD